MKITATEIGVDSGMIMISDLREYKMNPLLAMVFEVFDGEYKVNWYINNTWNGKVKGEGHLKVCTGKIIVTDPCYVIKGDKKWDNFTKHIHTGEDYDLREEVLEEMGICILDKHGGDGVFDVHITLTKKKE